MPNNEVQVLSQALRDDDAAVIRRAVSDGLDVNGYLGERKDQILTIATVRRADETMKALLGLGADVEQQDEYGATSLIIAASIGWLEGVKLLLQAGADVNARDKDGCTPLMEAVKDRTKERLEIVKLLIKAGADVNAVMTNRAIDVLVSAARDSSPAVLEQLLKAGANVNSCPIMGTGLIVAVEENRPDNVEVLLAHGADASMRIAADSGYDFRGLTALEFAKAKKLKKIVALLEGGGKIAAAKGATAPSVAESWKAIKSALKEQDRLSEMNLKRAATAASLGKFAAKWNVTLPDEFIESYRIHNGQESGGSDLIPSPTRVEGGDTFQLLPLDEIDSEWVSWNDVTATGQFQDTPSSPDKGIRDDWWNAGWIPFASNGGGDSICLDLNPAKGGKAGQVITMNHESSERRLLSSSFTEWLADLAESLEESN